MHLSEAATQGWPPFVLLARFEPGELQRWVKRQKVKPRTEEGFGEEY
jgi:hypothetical protein